MENHNGTITSLKTLRAAQIDRYFLVAAKLPFEVTGDAFEMLDFMAEDVRELKEGSQVFVYNKKAFGGNVEIQEEGLMEHLNRVAEEVGGIAVYPNIQTITLEENNG